ncbi:MAG: molybdopterin-binding protein [Chloroflexi bacterium]|nr:molybdopterin-binding protein [Chloroflexota bacterium]
MYWNTLPTGEAQGHLLVHNLADEHGHHVLRKGQKLNCEAIEQLLQVGITEVQVAVLEPGDVHEDEAGERLARALMGEHLKTSRPAGGRVNLVSQTLGVLEINSTLLRKVNHFPGLAVGTIPKYTVVHPRNLVATIKIIPYAVPATSLDEVDRLIADQGPVIHIRPIPPRKVAVILTSSPHGRIKTRETLEPPIFSRLQALAAEVITFAEVDQQVEPLCDKLEEVQAAGAELVLIAGETSIMDIQDTTPQAIIAAGGYIEHYGAPVEPGNLLLVAYLNQIPVLGAPGCVRSKDTNVVDMLLPRMLAGEHLTAEDVINLGEGGYMVKQGH